MAFDSFIGQINRASNFFPFESITSNDLISAVKGDCTWAFLDAGSRSISADAFLIDDDVIIEGAKDIGNSWISLVNQVLSTVLKFELIGMTWL